jgi:diguanylate cyclase (GGDEF)-like protein
VARKRLRLSSEAVAKVTVSLGAAELSSDRSDPDAILQRADEALYRAKGLGKDQVCAEEDSVPAS